MQSNIISKSAGIYDGPALFHVGFPKTATTYLQSAIFSDPAFGFGIAGGSESRGYIVQWFRTNDQYFFDPTAISAEMAQLEAPVRAQNLVPVWSEETLIGNPLTRQYEGAWALERLASIGVPLKILFTIRRQSDLVLSAYREYLKFSRHSLRDFIGYGDEPRSYRPILRPEYLCYDIAVGRWTAAFGDENLLVLPQELLKFDPDDYVRRLTSFVDVSDVPTPPMEAHNVGMGGTALAASRILNALFIRSPLSSRRSFCERAVRRVLSGINRLSPRMLDNAIERSWRSVIEDRFRGLYDKSNRRLEQQTGYDLASLGYPVADCRPDRTP